MLDYFPGHYTWNLAANLAITTGAQVGDVDKACRPIVENGAGTPVKPGMSPLQLAASWAETAAELSGLADEDAAHGRKYSAADKYRRAAVLFLGAERISPPAAPGSEQHYRDGIDRFERSLMPEDRTTRTTIPYGDTTLPALFKDASTDGKPAPCVVYLNGLDSSMEMCFGTGMPQELARRGISTLLIDQPGSGSALRHQGLTGLVEAEDYATAAYDYLTALPMVDPERIAVLGWSLGGYYAPRAAAMESRFAACVAWGAIYDWGELQQRRVVREAGGELSVPHYWDHVKWVFGCDTQEEFLEFSSKMTLTEISDQITMPFLIIHGSNDRQVPLEMAQLQYDAATGTDNKELIVVTDREGGIEHVGADNMRFTVCRIADWLDEVFTDV